MTDDEKQIRTLIESWADAVHRGDLPGTLADHAGDIVMFDVPPHEGVRGIDAYEETWPPFYDYQRVASFEIESLHVSASGEVAFAFALLRCDTPEGLAEHPERRLRLTLGLRKEGGRWVVAHEHHSFADESADPAVAEREVREVHERWYAGTAAKDLDAIMEPIADDVVSYEHDGSLQVTSEAEVREACRRGLDAAAGAVTWEVPDLRVVVRDDVAVGWGLNRMTHESADGEVVESWSRGTRVFQRRGGGWEMVHQHVSFPFDPGTGMACTDLKP